MRLIVCMGIKAFYRDLNYGSHRRWCEPRGTEHSCVAFHTISGVVQMPVWLQGEARKYRKDCPFDSVRTVLFVSFFSLPVLTCRVVAFDKNQKSFEKQYYVQGQRPVFDIEYIQFHLALEIQIGAAVDL